MTAACAHSATEIHRLGPISWSPALISVTHVEALSLRPTVRRILLVVALTLAIFVLSVMIDVGIDILRDLVRVEQTPPTFGPG